MYHPIIFIVGPTATGKSETAFLLAKEIGAQIVSADSMLVYKEPHILTAKPPQTVLDEVQHHFVSIISVQEQYDVYQYYVEATKTIKDLYQKNVPVIVCGGSGLYIKALLDGVFEGAGQDEALRQKLYAQAQVQGNEGLYERLKKVDPQTAHKISINDTKRIIRALEVYELSGVPLSEKKKQAQGLYGTMPIKIFGLRLSRQQLYNRINERVDWMIDHGGQQEAQELLACDLSLTAQKIIGVKEIQGVLEGKCSLDEAIATMKQNTRHFAKRQITWFKTDKRIQWIEADTLSAGEIKDKILEMVDI